MYVDCQPLLSRVQLLVALDLVVLELTYPVGVLVAYVRDSSIVVADVISMQCWLVANKSSRRRIGV